MIAVNHQSALAKALLQVGAAEGRQAAGQFAAVEAEHLHRIAGFEAALHLTHTGGKQRGAAGQQGLLGAGIDAHAALGQHGMGQPALAVAQRAIAGAEQGAWRLPGQQRLQHWMRLPAQRSCGLRRLLSCISRSMLVP